MRRVILAGDVGGTKTVLALVERGGSAREPVRHARFASGHYASLEAIVREFLDGGPERVTHAAFGIAGPVVDQNVETTNLPWLVRGRSMSEALAGAEVVLLNDLEATGWGLAELGEREMEWLQTGAPAMGNRALIAAGTGLGESILFRESRRWRPSPSEGGHADFAARDPLEDELLVWMRGKFGRVSYERVLSGKGLADLYRFLRATNRGEEPPAVAAEFDAAADPAVVVTRHALEGTCERARLAAERFSLVYGAETGNLALKALAVGGVFVGGGIAPKMLPVLRAGGFLEAFRSKGRLRPVLENMPVAIVLDDRAALWGAASVALALV
jgi:glucokinase